MKNSDSDVNNMSPNINTEKNVETVTSEKLNTKMESSNSVSDIINTAKTLNALPEKSKQIYEHQYELFVVWCKENDASTLKML